MHFMKVLYFDIDGTLIDEDTAKPKPVLADGRFEELVDEAHFDRLVCVGNIASVVQQVASLIPTADQKEIVFQYCAGVFKDKALFRKRVELMADPEHRGAHIDFSADWWYVDDLAPYYLNVESNGDILVKECGRRVFVPRANGDGSGVAAWLEKTLKPG